MSNSYHGDHLERSRTRMSTRNLSRTPSIQALHISNHSISITCFTKKKEDKHFRNHQRSPLYVRMNDISHVFLSYRRECLVGRKEGPTVCRK